LEFIRPLAKEPALSRLCRLMCGEAVPHRRKPFNFGEAAPRAGGAAATIGGGQDGERQSLSAHQAAQPQRTIRLLQEVYSTTARPKKVNVELKTIVFNSTFSGFAIPVRR